MRPTAKKLSHCRRHVVSVMKSLLCCVYVFVWPWQGLKCCLKLKRDTTLTNFDSIQLTINASVRGWEETGGNRSISVTWNRFYTISCSLEDFHVDSYLHWTLLCKSEYRRYTIRLIKAESVPTLGEIPIGVSGLTEPEMSRCWMALECSNYNQNPFDLIFK